MSARTRLIAFLGGGALLLAAALVAVVIATSGSSEDGLVVYTARSHYGEEEPFKRFAEDEGYDLTLTGGSAPELYERLRSEGERTRADVLITTDAANLWRADHDGLLEPIDSAELRRNVPADLRDPEGAWFGFTTRARTIMRSTERVGPERRHDLRGPRRSTLGGQALPALGHQRVQRLVRGGPARQGRPGGHRADAARLDGQRPRDPGLGRRRARRDRRGRLRRRAGELLLPRP